VTLARSNPIYPLSKKLDVSQSGSGYSGKSCRHFSESKCRVRRFLFYVRSQSSCEKRLLASSCPSARMEHSASLRPDLREINVKFYFFTKTCTFWKFDWNWTKIPDTLHKDVRKFIFPCCDWSSYMRQTMRNNTEHWWALLNTINCCLLR